MHVAFGLVRACSCRRRPRGGMVLAIATAALAAPHSGAETFLVNEQRSSVRVHVGRSGIFSFAGHSHDVSAPVSGSVEADGERLEASSVDLVFPAARFRVLPAGEPEGDAPKVEETMLGPRVLHAARFPEVHFRSRTVSGRRVGGDDARPLFAVQVTGALTIRGTRKDVVVPMRVTLDGDTLSGEGRCTIRHDQFGLTPVSAGAGTVRVRNEIEIEFRLVAERRRSANDGRDGAPGSRP